MAVDQTQYPLAMADDPTTGKPMPVVAAQLTGRNTTYQRLLANQALAANASTSVVINCGVGTKAISFNYKTTGTVQLQIYPCDAAGNPLMAGANIAQSSASYTAGALSLTEIAGVPYICLYITDKSAAANTIQFVDTWFTKA